MLPTDYVETGRYLRECRESLRVTLPQAAQALNIRAKYLEALEAGTFEGLPNKTYIRGYVRIYAQYLHLDPEAVLAAYASVLGGAKTADLFIPEPTLRQNMPGFGLIWLTLLGLILLYCYWYFHIHDSTQAKDEVAALPPKLAHLLDKPRPAGMDSAWANCLGGNDAECALRLFMQANTPSIEVLYDIELPNNPPQEP